MRKTGFKFASACYCALLLLSLSRAQTSGAPSQPQARPKSPPQPVEKPAATIRAESRLVVRDVVVIRHRQPAMGLTKSDFSVLEDGKPQPIVFFEAHLPPSAKAAEISRPSNQYTNFSAQTPSSINIVLFDVLNTPLLDQPHAREQMVQFLKTLPSRQQLALFELGTKLRMIADFSTTSDELEGSPNQEFFDRMQDFMGESLAARDEHRAGDEVIKTPAK
jgi:VWFA-related protein